MPHIGNRPLFIPPLPLGVRDCLLREISLEHYEMVSGDQNDYNTSEISYLIHLLLPQSSDTEPPWMMPGTNRTRDPKYNNEGSSLSVMDSAIILRLIIQCNDAL